MSQFLNQFYTLSTDKKFHICNKCKKCLTVSATGTTSHMWLHLQKFHTLLYKEAIKLRDDFKESKSKKRKSEEVVISGETKKVKQSNLSFHFQSSQRPKIDPATKKLYDRAVLEFIVADGRPFELAAGMGFKKLCDVLTDRRGYEPPHPTTLARHLGDIKQTTETKLSEILLHETKGAFTSVTFDHWKAHNGNNFLVLTIHFICAKWLLHKYCIAVVSLELQQADHTAAKTCAIIEQQLAKYDIKLQNVNYATTDTTAVMPCTARILNVKWQGCTAHMLQLVVKAALKVQPAVKNLIKEVHRIVGFFHNSSVGLKSLHAHQQNQSNPPLDTITRFNSTVTLLMWVQVNFNALAMALVECTVSGKCAMAPPQPLSDSSRTLLCKIIPILRPLAEATTMLSVHKTVSISLVQPCIKQLQQILEGITDLTGVSRLHQEVLKQIRERFDLNTSVFITSTFLDPRLKTATLTDDNVSAVTENLLTFIKTNKQLFPTKESKTN